MKVFVVTAEVELTKKPSWLDGFRARYDKPYHYHITLKQPCFIQDVEVVALKNKLEMLFKGSGAISGPIELSFDTLKTSIDKDDGCIMIRTSNDGPIHELQTKILECLSDYKDYFKPKYEQYELNFVPHITVARELTREKFDEALSELSKDLTCIGRVTKVVLTIVNNFGPEEANDPANRVEFNLEGRNQLDEIE